MRLTGGYERWIRVDRDGDRLVPIRWIENDELLAILIATLLPALLPTQNGLFRLAIVKQSNSDDIGWLTRQTQCVSVGQSTCRNQRAAIRFGYQQTSRIIVQNANIHVASFRAIVCVKGRVGTR